MFDKINILLKKVLEKSAGVWKGTALDSEKIWKKVFKRKSRKSRIRF